MQQMRGAHAFDERAGLRLVQKIGLMPAHVGRLFNWQVAHDGMHFIIARDERGRTMTTDEPGRAGDEHTLHKFRRRALQGLG
jgi:hypothetical protein